MAIEDRLRTSPYLASAYSIADISIAPVLAFARATAADPLDAPLPAITAWLTRIAERPAWRAVYSVD
jgi:glutathione S-transferase